MLSALDVIREAIMLVIAKSEGGVVQDLDLGQEIEETGEDEAEEADLEIGMRIPEEMIDIEVEDRHLNPDLLREIEAEEEIEETGTETTTEEIGTGTMTTIEEGPELKDGMIREKEMTGLIGLDRSLGQEMLTIGAKDQVKRAIIGRTLRDLEVLDPITSLKELKTEPRWTTTNLLLVTISFMTPTLLGLEEVVMFTKMNKSQINKKITTSDGQFVINSIFKSFYLLKNI